MSAVLFPPLTTSYGAAIKFEACPFTSVIACSSSMKGGRGRKRPIVNSPGEKSHPAADK